MSKHECCGVEMSEAGTAGKGLGYILRCARGCGYVRYSNPELVEKFNDEIIYGTREAAENGDGE